MGTTLSPRPANYISRLNQQIIPSCLHWRAIITMPFLLVSLRQNDISLDWTGESAICSHLCRQIVKYPRPSGAPGGKSAQAMQ